MFIYIVLASPCGLPTKLYTKFTKRGKLILANHVCRSIVNKALHLRDFEKNILKKTQDKII